MPEGTTLQISLSPTDLGHAEAIVPHQLRTWGGQVDEILFVVDVHRSQGQFGHRWDERLPGLRALLDGLGAQYPHARTVETDYRAEVACAIADRFCGGREVPLKDVRGGPFYAFLFGLHAASHPYVLHMDADMIFGGGSQTWLAEAVALLRRRDDLVLCSPLSGPPSPGGRRRQVNSPADPAVGQDAYLLTTMGFRVFLADLRIFPEAAPRAARSRAKRVLARIEGNPNSELLERLISDTMAATGTRRSDFLGAAPGMYSLHPRWRSGDFFEQLPSLIAQVEAGRVPADQAGWYDVGDSMVRWGALSPYMGGRLGIAVRPYLWYARDVKRRMRL